MSRSPPLLGPSRAVFQNLRAWIGEVLCRRQVSLGGKGRSKGNESKQAFVDRTRQERDAREAERRRQSCATKIQEQTRN